MRGAHAPLGGVLGEAVSVNQAVLEMAVNQAGLEVVVNQAPVRALSALLPALCAA